MKIKFIINADEDIVELDDNATEEEIVNELMDWVKRCVRYNWEIIEED